MPTPFVVRNQNPEIKLSTVFVVNFHNFRHISSYLNHRLHFGNLGTPTIYLIYTAVLYVV